MLAFYRIKGKTLRNYIKLLSVLSLVVETFYENFGKYKKNSVTFLTTPGSKIKNFRLKI